MSKSNESFEDFFFVAFIAIIIAIFISYIIIKLMQMNMVVYLFGGFIVGSTLYFVMICYKKIINYYCNKKENPL